MGWNGSGIEKVEVESSTSTSRFNYKALVAGLVVVIGGAIAAWVMLGGEKGEKGENGEKVRPSQIAEVAPQIVTNASADVEGPEEKLTNREKQIKWYRDKYGDNVPENMKPALYFLEHPPKRTFHPPKTRASIFKHRSERDIASLLLAKPGAVFIRQPQYGDRFDQDFAQSMLDKIEIAEDDPEDVRELKQAVADTKKELAARLKDGEVPSQIMTDTAKDLYELGKYRRGLEEEVARVRKDANVSNEEVADYVNAANKILEEKGLPPLKMPNMMIRSALIRQAERKKTAQGEK